MLPTFPRIVEWRAKANTDLIHEKVRERSGIIREIKSQYVIEGRRTAVHRSDGSSDSNPMSPIAAEVKIEKIATDKFDLYTLEKHCEEIADQMAVGISKMMFKTIDKVLEKTGNTVDATGKFMSPELILEAYERMDHTFRSDGSWEPPTMVASADQLKKVAFLSDPTDPRSIPFYRKLEEILVRKRNEFYSREADRGLVG